MSCILVLVCGDDDPVPGGTDGGDLDVGISCLLESLHECGSDTLHSIGGSGSKFQDSIDLNEWWSDVVYCDLNERLNPVTGVFLTEFLRVCCDVLENFVKSFILFQKRVYKVIVCSVNGDGEFLGDDLDELLGMLENKERKTQETTTEYPSGLKRYF